MQVFEHVAGLKKHLSQIRRKPRSLGFVPTMGALHMGHLSLIERARVDNDCVACSIFVNPTQFNDSNDYRLYPRDLENDLRCLRETGCDVVFAPPVSEVYPEGIPMDKDAIHGKDGISNGLAGFDPGPLDRVLEGKYRPGHFRGVAIVVKKLIDLFKPDAAYFGEKDYQQLLLVKRLVKIFHFPVEIAACPTVRNKDGLALSSRNVLLTPETRNSAPLIYQTLCRVKQDASEKTVKELKDWVARVFHGHPHLSLEYFEIADAMTLTPVLQWNNSSRVVACIAVYAGKVRLIDNIIFTP